MPQVTLYLDKATDAALRRAAREAGLSRSQWVAKVIRETTDASWPAFVHELAGSWQEAPTAEELRARQGGDTRRERL